MQIPQLRFRRRCHRLERQGKIVRQNGQCGLCDHTRKLNIVSLTSRSEHVAPLKAAQTRGIGARQQQEPVAIEDLRNQLDGFCKSLAVKHKVGNAASLAGLISALSDRGVIPLHEANMMHTVRSLRNAYVHDHIPMGTGETVIAKAAWEIITEWAEAHESEVWLTRRCSGRANTARR